VSAGHRLACDAAVDVLRAGGNAADAAVAAAAVQCVVELPWCGIGGDAFALVHVPGEGLHALNGSGTAPTRIESALSGAARAPRFGALSVAVPGWADALEQICSRFGSRPLVDLFAPAVRLAADGVPVDDRLGRALRRIAPASPEYPELASMLRQHGSGRDPILRLPDLARTLTSIAEQGARICYEGELGARIAAFVAARGGVLAGDDLASHVARWEAPVRCSYRGYEVAVSPPVSLAIALLVQLRILDGFDLARYEHNSSAVVELMVRCKLAAFAAVLPSVRDPAYEPVPVAHLLSDEHAAYWRAAVRRDVALPGVADVGVGGDTTSLAVVDGTGMTVVLIHSLFNEFGSREVVPGTGIVLNDRLANLPVGADRPQGVTGGRRPVHTLSPYLVLADGEPVFAGATPGGRGQVQTNFQVISNVIDFRFDLQRAVDAPRWLCGTPRSPGEDDVVHLEEGFPASVEPALMARGMQVRRTDADGTDLFGNCTVVGRDPANRERVAAADRRRGASAGSC
jgi:gamma-glutamyltranspeptidase/glutathione hydrolase